MLRLISLIVGVMLLVGCSNEKYVGPGDVPTPSAGMPATAAGTVAPNPGVAGSTGSSAAGVGVAGGAGAGAAGAAGAGAGGTMGPGPMTEPGVDGGNGPAPASPDGSVVAKPRLAITADFLHKTLSFIDIDKLREGGKRSDALVGEVDLGMYTPGPMSLNVTPDGKTALVSISGGFLGAFITVPAGPGILLFVDIETRKVTGELDVGDSPMGIVFSKDSKRAFVGLYSENYFAVVDVAAKTFMPVSTGSGFNEELAIDDSGTVGILTYGPSGNAVTFSVADPMGMNGNTLGLSGDAAGAAFFPGSKKAFLMQAPTFLTGNVGGHNVIDASNPASPVSSDNVRINAHPTTYPVTAVKARGSIAYPSTANGTVTIVEMKLEGDVAKEVKKVDAGAAGNLAYGITDTPDGKILIAVPGDHYIGVVDLEAGTAFHVPWEQTEAGPTEIKVVPQ